eukprot:CAMPEP_0119284594 /NCGR_PEP_ID=MMETSP1329-20130426/30556_1 /TAXON_ID=114041 /ORGANISM="Genus nov. species nov., Strain RCC1024" /LENGTH=181 /DNA_ID=CAMNT_0007285277 /DNA_START=167 /DNA_END=708 /DNA_ORIENTATION=-
MISRAGHAGHVARKLADIVKVPLLRKEPKERIREIWRGYHAERHDAVGMDMDASAASLLTDRAAAAPTFLHPVRREGGHFLLLSQFQDRRHFLYTFLEDYKQNPALARPYLSLTLHEDLARDREIVLLRGDVEKQLTKPEAEHLIDQTLQSYLVSSRFSAPGGALTFNQKPAAFDIDELLR